MTKSSSNEREGEGRYRVVTKAGLLIAPLALRACEAAAAIGISERQLWTLTNSGEVPSARLGRAIIYPVEALREWLADLVRPVKSRARGTNE